VTETTGIRKVGTVSVVNLAGRVTLGKAAESVRELIDQLLAEGAPQIVLNLAEVSFIDSAGLGVLVANLAKIKAAGGMLRIAEPQERVKDALELTRLTKLFPLYSTESEALDSFSQVETVTQVQ
jgi:anti-sigma B factor antagonist